MERNNGEAEVDSGSCNNLIRQDSLIEPQNAESNRPVDENNNALVASYDNATDSKMIPMVTVWCLMTLLYPVLNHICDFVSDICLVIEYFESQKTVDGSLTLAFVILQAIASAWISFLMHHPKLGVSSDENHEEIKENWCKRTAKLMARYSIVMVYQLALPVCRMRKLYCAWRLRKSQQQEDKVLQNYYHRKMLAEDRDSAVLEFVENFLQSAPQIILQLYILLTGDSAISLPMSFKICSGCVTIFFLSVSMQNYHCAIRLAQPDKAVISETGSALLGLWCLGTITARILAIGIAASNWLLYTSVALVINWIGWTAWIYAHENVVSVLHGQKTPLSGVSQTAMEKIRNLLLSGILAVVYTFTFTNLGEGRTFVRNSVYYILCLLQNGTVVLLCVLSTNLTVQNVRLKKDLSIILSAFFVVGIAAMIVYYMFFHPNLKTKICKLNATPRCVTCV